MGILSRLRIAPGRYAVPIGQQVELDSAYYYRQAFGRLYGHHDEPLTEQIDVALVPEPDNPHDRNAIRVLIDGTHVGHLPREYAALWAAYLAQREAHRERAHARAELWYRWSRGYDAPEVFLRVHIDHSPFEEQERARQLAERERAASEREAARGLAREASEAQRARRADARAAQSADAAGRRAAGLCVDCGRPLIPTTGRGRPPTRCAECRAARSGSS